MISGRPVPVSARECVLSRHCYNMHRTSCISHEVPHSTHCTSLVGLNPTREVFLPIQPCLRPSTCNAADAAVLALCCIAAHHICCVLCVMCVRGRFCVCAGPCACACACVLHVLCATTGSRGVRTSATPTRATRSGWSTRAHCASTAAAAPALLLQHCALQCATYSMMQRSHASCNMQCFWVTIDFPPSGRTQCGVREEEGDAVFAVCHSSLSTYGTR